MDEAPLSSNAPLLATRRAAEFDIWRFYILGTDLFVLIYATLIHEFIRSAFYSLMAGQKLPLLDLLQG